jgi:hypothetical protein
MSTSFSELKKSRSSQFEKLQSEASKINNKNSESNSGEDNRFWKPTVDKSMNGSAIIRFLPAPEGEDVPFVRFWDHGFQGPGGWYIERSLTSIGKDDPVGEYNSKLWNSGIEADKEVARKQKRRLHYISNIYVVKDPANPSNDGKVFLYQYGKKIFDKINDVMHPQFEDEKPVNPFDLWEGANFRLRIRNVEGYRNYDKSEFDKPSPLLEDDSALEATWKLEHRLTPFVDPSQFKSYEDLQKKLNKVLNLTGAFVPTSSAERVEEELPWSPPKEQKKAEAKSVLASGPSFGDDDDDASLEFFKKLANA